MKAGVLCAAALCALVLVGGGTAASSGCNDSAGCVTLGPGQALEVGTLLADFAPDTSNAVQIAVDLRGGSFAGHQIQVVRRSEGFCDDQSTINGARQLAARPAVVGVIGTYCSRDAFTAAPILGDTMLISPANTAPELTIAGTHPANFARVVADDRALGVGMAEYARNVLKAKSAGAVSIDGGQATAQAFVDRFKALKGKITGLAVVPPETTDFSGALNSLGNPDFVFGVDFGDQALALAQQARARSQFGLVYITGGLENVDGAYVPFQNSDGYGSAWDNQFVPAFMAKYGDTLDLFTAPSADATNLLLNAVASVATVTSVAGGTKVTIPRTALKNAVLATRNFQGYSAKLTCSALGDCVPNARIDILRSGGGDFVPVYIDPPA